MKIIHPIGAFYKMGDKNYPGWCLTSTVLSLRAFQSLHLAHGDILSTERVRNLHTSLCYSAEVIDEVANGLDSDYQGQLKRNRNRRHNFSRNQDQVNTVTLVDSAKSWLQTHEDAQIMLASVLVVIGIWWVMRAILALFIHLVSPLLVVILAVICVPQLRAPLLGQNYPMLANLLRRILIKMAETLKT